MASDGQRDNTTQPTFAQRFNEIQNSNLLYRQFTNAIRDHPVASAFLGTFLATSAIPLTIFTCFIFGTFIFGSLILFAVQGGIVFISGVTLLWSLLIPLMFSTGIAIAVLCGWIGLQMLRRLLGSLHEQDLGAPVAYITHHPLVEHPMDAWRDMTTRMRARMLQLHTPLTSTRSNQCQGDDSATESCEHAQTQQPDSEIESRRVASDLRECGEKLHQTASSASESESEDSAGTKHRAQVGHLGTLYDLSSEEEFPDHDPFRLSAQRPQQRNISTLQTPNDQKSSVLFKFGPFVMRAGAMKDTPRNDSGAEGPKDSV